MKLGVHLDPAVFSPVRPLVVPVVPGAGESLPSLVARSTRLNVLRHPRIILSEVGIEAMGAGTIGIDVAGLEHRLSAKIGCSVEDVLSRSTPFVPESANREIHYGRAAMSRNDFDLYVRRISPTSLKRAKIHLAAWTCRLLPFCPESLERLISVCPNCKVRLGWVAAWGVDTCEHCREVVIHPDGETLRPEFVEGYRAFSRLISPEQPVWETAVGLLAPEIAALPQPALVRFIMALGRNCRSDRIPQHNVGLMSPQQLATVVSLGTELIHDFPRRLRSTVVAEIDKIGWELEAPLRPLLKALRSIGSANVHRPKQNGLIRSAIPEVFEPKARALGGMRAPVMLLRDIISHASLSSERMKLIIEKRALDFSMSGTGQRPKIQYDQATTMDFIGRLKASVMSSEVEGHLGIPRYAVEQLVCLNELTQETHPAIGALFKGLRISGYEAFRRDLFAARQTGTAPDGLVTLARASRRIGGRYKPWGEILREMRGGNIDFWITDPDDDTDSRNNPFSKRASLLPSALSRFDAVEFDPSYYDHVDFFSEGMSQLDACELLNLDSLQISAVVVGGGLEFTQGQKLSLVASRKDVLQLASRMVSPSELSLRADIHPSSLQKHMKSFERVQPLFMGWDRTDVMRECPAQYSALGNSSVGSVV